MPYIQDIPHRLASKCLITNHQQRSIDEILSGRLISLYFELRILMYVGVMLFCTGIGTLLYKNRDSIGHGVILLFVIGITIGCFSYVLKRWKGFSIGPVDSGSPVSDYILLLGALMFATSMGYAEYSFQIFSGQHVIVALLVGVFYYLCAYAFDHRTVLVLSFASFAACLGLRIQSGFAMLGRNSTIIYEQAFWFGATFCLLGLTLDRFRIKKHFTISYINICGTVFQVAALSAVVEGRHWGVLMSLLGFVFFVGMAVMLKSFATALNAVFFAFLTVSYFLIHVMKYFGGVSVFLFFSAMYVIVSGLLFVLFIKQVRKHKLFSAEREGP